MRLVDCTYPVGVLFDELVHAHDQIGPELCGATLGGSWGRRNVLAEETCRQWLGGRDWVPSREDNLGVYGPENAHQRIEMRSLRSELVWVTVPGSQPWGIFRDVVELNGRKLENHEGRLAMLFGSPAPSALAQARKILEESSSYNLGPRRDVDLPTLGLLWLLPENQSRLELERKGERAIASLRGVEVEFREIATPTLVRDRGRDVPSSGRFWIDPTGGAVLRSEILYLERGFVSTEYRPESALDRAWRRRGRPQRMPARVHVVGVLLVVLQP